jgi:hypothetical protein
MEKEIWRNTDLEDLPNEEWRDIDGFDGFYQCSNLGRIKRCKRRRSIHGIVQIIEKPYIMRQTIRDDGYLAITIQYFGKRELFLVHRVICSTFIDNKVNHKEVNHKDGNKANNHIHNLEWVTHSENIKHSYSKLGRISSFSGKIGKLNYNSIPVIKKTKNGIFVERYDSARSAYRETNIDYGHISACCSGKRKSAGGFIWEYE